MKKKLLFLFTCLCIVCFAPAQEKSKIKFGNVKPEDFQNKLYAIDSSADAVVIADIGSTEFVGNKNGRFSLLFKNYRRVHILNAKGYDIANVEIPLYANGENEEELQNLKAVTYNLEKGKVVESKLDVKFAVFKDKINKNLVIRKFTFPNLKEGSIIEYEYKIMSDFIFNLQPWEFQGFYPRLWSEYNVTMPEFYNYVTLTQGYQPYAIQDQKERRENFVISSSGGTAATTHSSFSANVTDYRKVMKNVPALKEEGFTSTLKNHISRIEFQLQSVRDPLQYQEVMTSWPNVSKQLMEDEAFGSQLKKDNGWLNDIMPIALKAAVTEMEKAKNIYTWIRDNLTCTNYNRKYLEQNLKNVLKNRNGNVAEINLLLVAMLRKAGFDASPVMLSTRSHGYAHSVYPLMDRLNYVICQVVIGNKQLYLDASRPLMGFGKLSTECYNGAARIINEEATPVDLLPDSVMELKQTSIFIINNDKANLIGSMQQVPGYYESYGLRSRVKESGKEQLIKDIQKGFGAEITTRNERIDSLDKYEEPIGIFYEFEINGWEEDVEYLNPMFGEGYKENPFKSTQRFYPVEMPYTMDELYTLQFEVPNGYVVDELPKQALVKFNEQEDAFFEYRISQSGTSISLRSRVRIKRAWFDPEEYETLREFFNLIVKKHSEQIVFKKKK
jgi:hypothetical protein